MKKFFVIAAMTLAANPVIHPPVARAEAKGTYCASEGVADAGYGIEIAANGKTAVLSEESFAGARKVADMDCVPGQVRTYPDALNNYLVCQDVRNVDGGLMVRVFSGGIAGLHYASVRQVTVLRGKTFESEVQFGHLNCRR